MAQARILITGSDGQLGWELARTFADVGEVHALGRAQLDLADTNAIRARCREIKPTLILNAAAYTAVDKAESEPEIAMQLNGIAPAVMAEEANRLSIPMIHYSTDYVFDGNATRPYREDDPTSPQSVYGETKLVGEIAVTGIAREYLVLRTSWLYSNRRQNFLLTMLRLARERDELRVVADQIGSPTWVRSVASMTAAAIATETDTASLRAPTGVYHVAATGQTSWHGFAEAILEGTPESTRRAKNVVPIATLDYPTPAKRPPYSVLDATKIARALAQEIPSWRSQLRDCLAENPLAKSG